MMCFFNWQHFSGFGHCDGCRGVAIAALAHLAAGFGGGYFMGEDAFVFFFCGSVLSDFDSYCRALVDLMQTVCLSEAGFCGFCRGKRFCDGGGFCRGDFSCGCFGNKWR